MNRDKRRSDPPPVRARLRRAKELLDRGCRVEDAALAAGMESAASFSALFQAREGISPWDYAAQRALEYPRHVCQTPLGPVCITEDRQGIRSLCFLDGPAAPAGRGGLYLADAEAQLAEYFAGRRRTFDLPLSIHGSPFQERVWAALRGIPYGETRCYQQIARAVGNEQAARAVGMANNRNPISILVPCHRVVGKDGALVGYAGGLQRKRFLLDLEARLGKERV